MSQTPAIRDYGIRVLLTLAWPVVVARSAQAVINYADARMTAPLGEAALAAVTTGGINVLAISVLPLGIVFIVQSFAAQLQGRGDMAAARRYGWYGLVLAAMATALSAAAMPWIDEILGLFPYERDVHDDMSAYMSIRLLAVGGMVATEALGNWYAGLGNTRLQMIAAMVAMVLNVALNWLLIGGNLGMPALGVEGAAWASVIATWCGFGVVAAAFFGGAGYERVAGPLGLRLSELRRMLRFGAPNGVNWFLEFGALWIFINVVIADLGTLPLAAMMVVIQLNSVAFMPAFGLGSAGAILVGQAIGRGDHDQVPRITRRTAAVAACWMGLVGLLYVSLPSLLFAPFAAGAEAADELLAIGATMLAVSAAWQLFDALAITVGEALRAAGDTAWSMYARIALAWFVFMPSALISVRVLDGGYVAALWCLVGYLVVLSAALVWRFSSGRWREIDLTGHSLEPVVV